MSGVFHRALLALALTAGAGLAADPPALRISRAPRAPRIEDFMPGGAHEYAAAVTGFVQRTPADGRPSSQPTTAFLAYDDANLYAAFVCSEDPSRVRAHLARRDAISGDDLVGVSLDTFHDHRRAYVFLANALGVQMDGIAVDGQEDDWNFDAVWRSEGRLSSDGYVVLMAIPFRVLRSSAGRGGAWGIALSRHTPRLNEVATWPSITERREGYVSQFAELTGVEPRTRDWKAQVNPYVAVTSASLMDRFTGPERTREWRGGADAKLVLHDAFSLDLTIQPDFSQVESDDPQVLVNQRYEVYFPEKRPFFLENAGFFATPETAFFSRRIVDPKYGARLTGKYGNWAIGLLSAEDRNPSDPARIGVARIQREFANQSSFGVLFEKRDAFGHASELVSADTRLKLNDNWVFTGQLLRSSLTGEHPLTGNAAVAEIRHTGRHLTYSTNYRDRSPDFRAELGFMPRVDMRQLKNVAGYRWRPEGAAIVGFGPSMFTTVNWNRAGDVQDWSVDVPFWIDFRGATSIAAGRNEGYELFSGQGFRKRSTYVYLTSERWKRVTFYASLSRGRNINFYPAAGVRPFASTAADMDAGITLRPNARLRFDSTWLASDLGPASTPVFRDRLLRFKTQYQFNRTLGLRFIADYHVNRLNPLLASDNPYRRITADVLASYVLHPGTVVYAGYTNRLSYGMLPDGRFGALERRGSQLFIKVSYLLHL